MDQKIPGSSLGWFSGTSVLWVYQVALVVKNPLPLEDPQETQVRSLGWE